MALSAHVHTYAYVNFLRWTSQFEKNEMREHDRYQRVYELSDLQSMRFMVCATAEQAFLFTQHPERWMTLLPIRAAVCIADRLYLLLNQVTLKDGMSVHNSAIGLAFDDAAMRKAFATVPTLTVASVVLGNNEQVLQVNNPQQTVDLIGDGTEALLKKHCEQRRSGLMVKSLQF